LVNSLLPTDLRERNNRYYTQAFSYVKGELVLDRKHCAKKINFVFPLFPSEKNAVNFWELRNRFRTNFCSEKYNKTRYGLRIKWAKITDTNRSEILTFTEFRQNTLCSFKVTDCNVTIMSSVYECTLGEHATYTGIHVEICRNIPSVWEKCNTQKDTICGTRSRNSTT
jgi:hypothetical protein